MQDTFVTKRVRFRSVAAQISFMQSVKERSGLKWSELAVQFDLHSRTLRDWARGKFLIPEEAYEKLKALNDGDAPPVRQVDVLKKLSASGAKGGRSIIKKYGRINVDEKYRKKKWYEWWENEGQYQDRDIFKRMPFAEAIESEKFAELTGIVLGDGGISERQIIITLNSVDDLDYSFHVQNLLEKLFKVRVGRTIHKSCHAVSLYVSRTDLVGWFTEVNNFKIGDKQKQQIAVPLWIRKNPLYAARCLRGLVDTDGSLFVHKYKVGGKEYSYKKLVFSNVSRPLIRFVHELLLDLGIKGRIIKTGLKKGKEVRVDAVSDVKRYMEFVGTSNPKILNLWRK